MKLLNSAVLPDAGPDIAEAIATIRPPPFPLTVHRNVPSRSEFIERLHGHKAVISDGTPIDSTILAECPDIRSIVFLGTGVDFYIDRFACDRAGVSLEGISGYGDRTVAEHAFALMLAVYRDLGTQQILMRGGGWGGRPIGELRGKTLGVIGLGAVGGELARLAAAFGMEVIGWSRAPSEHAVCERVELEELLRRADIVSLHLAATTETAGFLDESTIGRMKRGAVLINTARSALIDEAALIRSLEDGHLAGAGLDVFDQEPPEANAPIRSAPNLVLSCHSAWRSPEAARELVQLAYIRVKQILAES